MSEPSDFDLGKEPLRDTSDLVACAKVFVDWMREELTDDYYLEFQVPDQVIEAHKKMMDFFYPPETTPKKVETLTIAYRPCDFPGMTPEQVADRFQKIMDNPDSTQLKSTAPINPADCDRDPSPRSDL